ncbi:class I SAM-dependent methyltransferase [Pinibacter aurantiacus]|uniref:Class I SAM-dependent methyltransferase n=1 Tax=Pinibacter aurantiacus TaxID=2851599 RepID=A0A9E2S6A1_9BACT|nr:class I SAM-dependent methyltransferase [Pinibacter aurantiacus]MBV4355732.1 class I SAM-dependent methyltransferase [Pinibacter aurantiacus]
MQLTEAIELIKDPEIGADEPQSWADFGCGSGLFTKALASMLPASSVIYAVDMQPSLAPNVLPNKTRIEVIKADFVNDQLELPNLNGILMANSLHYVKDKKSFLLSVTGKLVSDPQFVIVEYNTLSSNRWVPYPIDFSSLKQLFAGIGFTTIKKINERTSIYNEVKMYSALIRS